MTEHYLDRLARTINANWDAPALTDFYLTEDGTAQDTSRGNHYTYGEMYMEMLRLGELFKQLGLQKGDHIAICGANSAHWAIAYLAIAAYQGVSVTILHTQSPEDIARQIDFSDAKALFTDEDLWREVKVQSMPQIEQVISLENWHVLCGKKVQKTIQEVGMGKQKVSLELGDAEDLAMICFTSGSSGNAKGVMIPNRSINNVALNEIHGFPKSTNKNYVSLLPFAHTYGMMTDMIGQLVLEKHIYIPHTIGAIQILTIMSIVKPYAIVTIPNVLALLYSKYKGQLSTVIGGRCEQLYIGGAALSQELTEGMVAMGMPFSMGYGVSETCFLISYIQSHEYRFKSAGKICSGMTACIAPNGEILVKGENVMLGYYKNPEATAQKIDADGWLHTGDRGYLDEDGYLYVEGRLEQDMIVLPNGENIHPDNIESKINALPEVAESIVIAREGKLVAIVVVSGELSADSRTALRLSILRSVNAQLPMYAQIYDIEWSEEPLARTAKQTIKRYLYK